MQERTAVLYRLWTRFKSHANDRPYQVAALRPSPLAIRLPSPPSLLQQRCREKGARVRVTRQSRKNACVQFAKDAIVDL
jgi:hypothetical protein